MRPPLERTHDISQIGYHMKDLRAFGEDLTNAVAGAFPKGKSRYNEVHVLLLSWEDDGLGVMEEINELRSVLDQTFHYHTEEWKIPSRRSHNSLVKRLTEFLDEYECKENLLLIYYGGHGHLNDDRQLTWSCTELEDSPTVKWIGIQNMLEQATSDVLILLDCCAAATASAEQGNGVTEVIAACGFETTAPGVCEHSFTRGLIEELQYFSKRSPLSAAMLHMKVLSRMKYWKPKNVETRSGELAFHERRRTPVHTILTNDGRPRSIVLSPIESSTFLSPEISASLAHSLFSDSSSDDVEMEDSSNDSAMTSIPSSVSSSCNYFEQSCPTVLIAVALEEDQQLQLDTWGEWLRDIPAMAKHARVEGIYESFSTLMLISLPVYIWDLIPNNPAVSLVGFIKSRNLLKNQPSESSTAQAASSAPPSTSLLGSSLKTDTLCDTTRVIRTSEATSSRLRQTYSAVTAAYDTYIQLMDLLPGYHLPDYQQMRMGLMIERYRIDLWGRFVLAKDKTGQGNLPTYKIGLWALFEGILTNMLEAFPRTPLPIKVYGTHNNITSQEGLSEALQFASIQPRERSHERSELLETITSATKWLPKHSLMKSLDYDILEKKHIERLLQTLCYWNDSLDGLTSTLERESSRRRLRAHFSTSSIAELQNLEAAAAFLKHQDIERMANARSVIEQEQSPEYRLEADNLEWQEVLYRPSAMATLRGESVIVDWQDCLDGPWRREYPAIARRRINNLITILKTCLRPLELSVLHCVGYLERTPNKIGYAFLLPPDAEPGLNWITLHHLLRSVRNGDDIPNLDKRFQLAKALVSTVFEIHSLGLSHRSIQPKNILFWRNTHSKGNIDIGKPYLIGFDISGPEKFSQQPTSHPENDLYRHPSYKAAAPHLFQPSFDMYSLGVVLFEIGIWRCAKVAHWPALDKYRPLPTPPSSEDIIISQKDAPVGQLKRFMGKKYRDAVLACLEMEFDNIWEEQEGDEEKLLHTYLDQVQNKVVDPISECSV